MKKHLKIISLLLLLVIIILPGSPSFAQEVTESFTITVNGKVVNSDVKPYIENNNIMVPVRFVSEALGCQTKYSVSKEYYNSKTVTVSGLNSDDLGLMLFIGKNRAYIGTSVYKLPTAPVIKNGRTFIPMRFLAEYLNCSVSWDNVNRNAIINTNDDFSNDVFERHFDRRATDKLEKWTKNKTHDKFDKIFKDGCDCV